MAAASEDLALPPDNASRIAIFDALYEFGKDAAGEYARVPVDELRERVIGRLRVLVPRELHLAGEEAYLDEKVRLCVADGTVARVGSELALTGKVPKIGYADGTIRDYRPGLQAAIERLDRNDRQLRARNFDVHRFVPSIAASQESDAFQALVASMREHGYLKQFRIVRGADGVILDGRARAAAAEIVQVRVEEMPPKERLLPRRRDTPLQRVLLLLSLNHARLSDEDRERVREAASAEAGRPWREIADDLAATQDWRTATPLPTKPVLDVKRVRFRNDGPPDVQITRDGRVMLRSLLEAAGMPAYRYTDLREYVAFEEAKTKYTANRKAIFVRIEDAIAGISEMQRARKKRNLRLDQRWIAIKRWLMTQAGEEVGESDDADLEASSTAIS